METIFMNTIVKQINLTDIGSILQINLVLEGIKHDPIMTQEQSVLTKLDIYFKTEDKLFQHSLLG